MIVWELAIVDFLNTVSLSEHYPLLQCAESRIIQLRKSSGLLVVAPRSRATSHGRQRPSSPGLGVPEGRCWVTAGS